MAKDRIHADFTAVRCIWDVWDGTIPMRRTEDQATISNNVLFMTLQFGAHTSCKSGVDYYYFKKTDEGWVVVIWVDPIQEWAVPGKVGTKYSFNKTTGEITQELLTEVPVLVGAHDGILISDDDWARL